MSSFSVVVRSSLNHSALDFGFSALCGLTKGHVTNVAFENKNLFMVTPTQPLLRKVFKNP